VLSRHEVYDEPLATELRRMWVARSHDDRWLSRPGPTVAETVRDSGQFGPPVVTSHRTRRTLPASGVLDLERTRATWLDWTPRDRRGFTEELRALLHAGPVGLTQVVDLTMAPVARHDRPASSPS
jgi:hypothetical protein